MGSGFRFLFGMLSVILRQTFVYLLHRRIAFTCWIPFSPLSSGILPSSPLFFRLLISTAGTKKWSANPNRTNRNSRLAKQGRKEEIKIWFDCICTLWKVSWWRTYYQCQVDEQESTCRCQRPTTSVIIIFFLWKRFRSAPIREELVIPTVHDDPSDIVLFIFKSTGAKLHTRAREAFHLDVL